MMVDDGMHEFICEKLILMLPKSAKILDMGCGEGALTQRLVDNGFLVTSVDKQPNYFKAKGATFVGLDFDDNQAVTKFLEGYADVFDCVIGIEVIEHVQDQYAYTKMLATLTKPSGYVLISTPNISNRISRVIFLLSGRFHQFQPGDLSYGHINPVTFWQLKHIIESSNLSFISMHELGNLPYIYIATIKTLLLSFLSLALLPFQTGISNGWCILSISQKP